MTRYRDAENWMIGGTHVFRFAEDRHYIRVGYQFDYEKADGRNYTYAGNRFLAGGQYTLPWGSTRLKYDFDLHQRHYLHANTLLPAVNPARGSARTSSRTTSSGSSRSSPRTWGRPRSAARRPRPVRSRSPPSTSGRSRTPTWRSYSFNRNVWSLTLSWQY